MTPSSVLVSQLEHEPLLRHVETGLRRATARLRVDPSPADVGIARDAIEDAERALGELVHDPGAPWTHLCAMPVRS